MNHPVHQDQLVSINVLNVLKKIAQNYSFMGVLYEFFKNIEDRRDGLRKASFITFEFNTKRREIVIYGDNPGIDEVEMLRIIKSVADSAKSNENFGLGLQSFLKFSDRFIFISKKDGEHYIFSETPHEDDTNIYSDTGGPHRMTGQEAVQYDSYCHKIHKYTDGTVYIIENVGVGIEKFNMAKNLSKADLIKHLRTVANTSLRKLRVSVSVDGEAPEVIMAKDGSGTHYSFTVPSAKCLFDRPRTVVCEGKTFELSIHIDVWVGTRNSGLVTIGEKRSKREAIQNELPIDMAYGNQTSLRRGDSIFRSSSLSHYLDGHVYYTLYSKEGAEPPSFYTANRDHLILDNSFGNLLTNLLNVADIDVLRPAALKKEEESTHRTDDKLNKKYEKLLETLLSSFEFDFLEMNWGPVKDQKRTCPACGVELPLEKTLVYNKTPIKINKIFFVKLGDREFYQCGMCKKEWEKTQRTVSEPKERTKVPIYEPPMNQSETKDRERRKGYGYNLRLFNFGNNDSRMSVFIAPSLIEINTGHPYFTAIKNPDIKHLRNLHLICHEIITHSESMRNRPAIDQQKAIQEMFCAFCSKFEEVDMRTM